MREAILGSLASFMQAANFPAKRDYVMNLNGLKQISNWVCVHGTEEEIKFGQGEQLLKIRISLASLLYDLVINDDSIIGQGFFIRDTLAKHQSLVKRLLDSVVDSDLRVSREAQLREYTLNILFRLYQRKPDLKR